MWVRKMFVAGYKGRYLLFMLVIEGHIGVGVAICCRRLDGWFCHV